MVNSVKGFLKIYKNATSKFFVIKVGVYLLYYAKKSVVGGVLLPESKLVFVDEVVFIDEMFHAVVHKSFKDFTDVRQKRDGPVVSTFGLVIFFENSTN